MAKGWHGSSEAHAAAARKGWERRRHQSVAADRKSRGKGRATGMSRNPVRAQGKRRGLKFSEYFRSRSVSSRVPHVPTPKRRFGGKGYRRKKH